MNNIEISEEETRQLFRQVYVDMVREHGDKLTIKDTIFFDMMMKEVRKRLATTDKKYPSQEFCHYLHGKILESDVSEKDTIKSILEPAIDEALEEFNQDRSYWDDVKGVQMKSKHFKHVVDAYMDHPAQVSLIETTGCSKGDLYSSGTINKHTRNLIKQKKTEDRIRNLELMVQELSGELKQTRACAEQSLELSQSLEERINHVETKLNSNISDEDWVLNLANQGVPTRDIADITKLHIRKVQRIIQQNKS